jgi:hypothetical protein
MHNEWKGDNNDRLHNSNLPIELSCVVQSRRPRRKKKVTDSGERRKEERNIPQTHYFFFGGCQSEVPCSVSHSAAVTSMSSVLSVPSSSSSSSSAADVDVNALHVIENEKSQTQEVTTKTIFTFLLVDTESYDGLHLSEIGTIALSFCWNSFSASWCVDSTKSFHALVRPPLGYNKTDPLNEFIESTLTGLDPDRLSKEGVHYLTALDLWNEFCHSFPANTVKLARDPRLDKTLLRDTSIGEICWFLRAPMNELFIFRKFRPKEIEEACHQENCCPYHSSKHVHSRNLHCALEDCHIIANWLAQFGMFLAWIPSDLAKTMKQEKTKAKSKSCNLPLHDNFVKINPPHSDYTYSNPETPRTLDLFLSVAKRKVKHKTQRNTDTPSDNR